MVKKLMESIREQKKNSILAMVTISGEVAFEVIIPLLMANLIDYGIDMGDMGYIVKMGIVLLLSALGQLFCGAISGKFAAIASSGFARNLRHDMFYKVQNYSFSNIDKFSTASIVTRLTTDVTNLQNTYQMIIRMAVRSPLMAIFSLVAGIRHRRQALAYLPCHHPGARSRPVLHHDENAPDLRARVQNL